MEKYRIHKDWTYHKEGEEKKHKITLPHDAMIYEKRRPDLENGGATGFFPGGTYIYEKDLFGEQAFAKKTVLLEFEGIYQHSTVYLNEEKLGGWLYGYTNFYVDLTGKLRVGEDNHLKVVADNSKTPNSRWYSGSGIYRPVNLWIGEEDCILPEQIQVKTVSIEPAVVEIMVKEETEPNMPASAAGSRGKADAYRFRVLDRNGRILAEETMPAGESKLWLEIPGASLWSAETPEIYTLETTLSADGKDMDTDRQRFGIRMLNWDAGKGFLVNGTPVKLRGGCVHHDHGILGAAAWDQAEERRIRAMKERGFNAIRYSHNPAGKNFLDLCDELGMYVIDESFDQWKMPQTAYDYAGCFDEEWEKDARAMVSKDFNHPCVIMYGIGNEITDLGLPFGKDLAKLLGAKFHQLDDSRPTMIANNHMLTVLGNMKAKKMAEAKARAQKEGKPENGEVLGSEQVNEIVAMLPKIMAETKPDQLEEIAGESFDAVDIVGYNYGSILYEGTHAAVPERVILSSETFPSKMYQNWKQVTDHTYVIGDFLWTAWDYLGEAGVGLPVYGVKEAPFSKEYPCLTAACGTTDLTGFAEPAAHYNAIIWGKEKGPYLAVRPVNHSGEDYTMGNWRLTDSIACWTWDGCEGKQAQVEVYAAASYVSLYQNDVLVGTKETKEDRCVFSVRYDPGTLQAVALDDEKKPIGQACLETAGEEILPRVLPEKDIIKADGEDIVFVPIQLEDAAGNLQMTRDRRINVRVTGAARLLALGSGRPETEEDFHDNTHLSWHGRALAVLQSTGEEGKITVRVETEDGEASEKTLYAEGAK